MVQLPPKPKNFVPKIKKKLKSKFRLWGRISPQTRRGSRFFFQSIRILALATQFPPIPYVSLVSGMYTQALPLPGETVMFGNGCILIIFHDVAVPSYCLVFPLRSISNTFPKNYLILCNLT